MTDTTKPAADKITVKRLYVIKNNEEDALAYSSYGKLFAELENGDTVEIRDFTEYVDCSAHLKPLPNQ